MRGARGRPSTSSALLLVTILLLISFITAATASTTATHTTSAARRLFSSTCRPLVRVQGGGAAGAAAGSKSLGFVGGARGFDSFHRRRPPPLPARSRCFAAAASPTTAEPEATKPQQKQQPKRSAWGQRVVPFRSEAVGTDVTEELLSRGLPELPDIREGLAFFHVQAQQGHHSLRVASGGGDGDGDGAAGQSSFGRVVGVPIENGRLVLSPGDASSSSPRIHLVGSSADKSMEGSKAKEGDLSVAVTWNGDKVRAGSSHRCEVREAETSAPRKEALDKALAELGVDIQELTVEEQVTGSGSSALRSYLSFVQPRPGKQHGPVDNALDLAANRAANQIAFLVRAYRAEQAEYLRNHDQAMDALKARNLTMHPIKLVLDNVRSAYNVGSIFRTAETALVEEVVTAGFTPHPPHAKLSKTACRSVENVPTRHFPTTLEAVKALKQEGYAVFAMETTTRSVCYTHVREFPRKLCLVLGNEVIGVDTAVLELCDQIVEIPTFGQKNSLNVASAAPVVVYEVLRQWGCMDAQPPDNQHREQAAGGEDESHA